MKSVRASVRGRNQKEKINCNACYAAMEPKIRRHLDEVFVRINGNTHYLWRAVDHEGEVLETFVTKKRDRKTALKFIKKTMKRYGRPEIIVPVAIATDKLRSYRAAMKMIGNEVRQETQRFLNIQSATYNTFYLQRYLLNGAFFKQCRTEAFEVWRIAGIAT